MRTLLSLRRKSFFFNKNNLMVCVLMLWSMNLAVMHDMRLIHTDLKPENILFVSPEYVKVPDYKVHLLLCTFSIFAFVVPWRRISCKNFSIHYRLHPGHQKREPIISGCQSLVQLRLLILAAQLMSIKTTTILSLLDTTVPLRLFLVC